VQVCAKLIGFPPRAIARGASSHFESAAQGTEPGKTVDLPEGATARDLWTRLGRRRPEGDHFVDHVLVDGKEADLTTPLRDGAAVVFFGPAADRQ
jgi:molybdopterin converting factor small subunit